MADVVQQLAALGVEPGGVLLVHAAFSRISPVEGGPHGLIAALLYALFQPGTSFKNLAFNGELLMNLPIVWAWALAFWPGKSRKRPELFLAGVLCCLAFLLKLGADVVESQHLRIALATNWPGGPRSRSGRRAEGGRWPTWLAKRQRASR